MRCATCGTENAPDSRFCGGCGARMPAAQGLVAPTQKISDDARYPNSGSVPTPTPSPNPYYAPPPASIPPTNTVASGPPVMPGQGPSSIPPQNSYQSGPTHTPPPSLPPQNYAPSSIPPQNSQQHGPQSIPPSNVAPPRGGSMPPANNPPAPSPAGSRPPRASLAAKPSSASLSAPLAPRGRRWGLIIVILLFDLALAGAGAYLLREGLA